MVEFVSSRGPYCEPSERVQASLPKKDVSVNHLLTKIRNDVKRGKTPTRDVRFDPLKSINALKGRATCLKKPRNRYGLSVS